MLPCQALWPWQLIGFDEHQLALHHVLPKLLVMCGFGMGHVVCVCVCVYVSKVGCHTENYCTGGRCSPHAELFAEASVPVQSPQQGTSLSGQELKVNGLPFFSVSSQPVVNG